MLGDLNLGDFEFQTQSFVFMRGERFFSLADSRYLLIFPVGSIVHVPRQWSNRPHNKFTHYENNSFGSFTSDVLCRSACKHGLYRWPFN